MGSNPLAKAKVGTTYPHRPKSKTWPAACFLRFIPSHPKKGELVLDIPTRIKKLNIEKKTKIKQLLV